MYELYLQIQLQHLRNFLKNLKLFVNYVASVQWTTLSIEAKWKRSPAANEFGKTRT